MKYYFPIHLDGGNRGCEAIAKGTAVILQEKKENLVGLCRDIELDSRLGIYKYVTLVPVRKKSLLYRVYLKIRRFTTKDKEKRKSLSFKYLYAPFINKMKHDDILVSTGGDMMCYENNEVNYTVNLAHQKGIKSILWGCSIGEENLTKEKLESLQNFSIIYARETMTKDVLNKHNINNVIVYPDPAFILEPEKCELPECFFLGDVIGVNLSNFVLGGFELDTPFSKEIIELFEYVINQTSYHILLIPHVFWKGQDDRIVCHAIEKRFQTQRISILNSEKLNYCQIRYVISKCKLFIGARTHAVISAYSTCVPAIALGYSIKSQGIAKDVGIPSWSVVDCKNMGIMKLIDVFKQIVKTEKEFRFLLKKEIPFYKEKISLLPNIIKAV